MNQPISKRFTLEDMETYFHNYVPCDKHPQSPITNFCTESNCFRVMCPQCVEIHSKHFESHYVQSIRSIIGRSSKKLLNAVDVLQKERDEGSLRGSTSPQEYTQKMIGNLRKLRSQLIQEINQYFDQKEKAIEDEVRNRWKTFQTLSVAGSKLDQAINQLNLLHNNLFLTDRTVEAIKKISLVDFKALCEHFKSQTMKLKAAGSVGLTITVDEDKRKEFRRILFGLIEVDSKRPKQTIASPHIHSRHHEPQQKRIVINTANKSLYPSADYSAKKTEKGLLDITMPNTMTRSPFLHFFQALNRSLHILPVEPLEHQSVEWRIIMLRIDFDIPTFHRSIALKSGAILMIGGSWADRKLNKVYQYDAQNERLRELGSMLTARSSHSVACINQRVYIVGGFVTGGTVTEKCEMFDGSTFKTYPMPNMAYATANSCLTPVSGRKLIKVGGMMADETNCHFIEVYDCQRNLWETVDPTVQSFQGEFSLLSNSASIQINENQVFIFGGYNEENNNQVSQMSFVLEWSGREYSIRDINLKTLPLAEGFWNNHPVIFNHKLYCIQNVADPDSNNCLENRRNALVFNGRVWKHIQQS